MKNSKLVIFATLLLINVSMATYGMEQDDYTIDQAMKHKHYDILKALAVDSQRDNEICVTMWESRSITASPTIKAPLIISTYGLDGCLATSLHIKYSNDEQYANITHYPPASFKDQEKDITMSCIQALTAQNETKKIVATRFFFHAPKEYPANLPALDTNLFYEKLQYVVNTQLQETKTIETDFLHYDMPNYYFEGRDVEIILYPRFAVIKTRNERMELT